MSVRINKFLADLGVASRRAIDMFIVEKRITINGIVLEKPGYMVNDDDVITLDGKKIIREKKNPVTILLNKPLSCITTVSDTHGRKTVLDYIASDTRVFPIGRLDRNTTGALLLTNDGDLAHTLMHPKHHVEKVYRAYIDAPFIDRDKKIFETGIVLDGVKTVPCQTHFFESDRRDIVITLHEGKNRQIHRMFHVLRYTVQKLDRIRYAGLEVRDLKRGEWRYLSKKEVESLKKKNIDSAKIG